MASESYSEKYKCISRIDNENNSTFGWEVRIRRNKKQVNKFFSDSSYENDPHQSLLAAMEIRDALLKQIPKLSRVERAQLKRKNCSSGIPGVSLTVNRKKYKGKTYEYRFWQAYWSPEPGKTKSVRFSVSKYGEEEAKRRAVEARTEALKEIQK